MRHFAIFFFFAFASIASAASPPVGGSTSTPTDYSLTIKSKDIITKGPVIDVRAYLPAGAVTDASVDYQSGVAAAVAAAYAAGLELYWPYVYLTSASIPNFHGVKHRGPGGVKRGSTIFYVSPTSGQTNTLYVATAGNDSNDGITASQPMLTFQEPIDTLSNYGPMLGGAWIIDLAAGTYARGRFPDIGLASENEVVVQGPDVGGHPNVPTAIIKEGATQAAFGILATRMNLRIKNIKVEDYNGSTSSSGIRINSGELHTENVHIQDCYYGITGADKSLLDIKGGIFDDCGYLNSDSGQGTGHAIRGIFHTKFEVGTQSAGTLAGGPIIRNSAGALRGQELCTGHLDWVTVEDCFSGVRLLVNSRLNVDGSSFKRVSSSAIYATQGSHADPSANTVFGTGADVNGSNYSVGLASSASTGMDIGITNTANGAAANCIRAAFPGTVVTATGSTNTIDTLDLTAGAFANTLLTGIPAKKITVVVKGVIAGTTGTYKRLAIRLGASTVAILSFAGSETGDFEVIGDVSFTGAATQFMTIKGVINGGTVTRRVHTSSTVDMSVDETLKLQAYVQNSADSITINSYEWFVQGI